MEIIREHENEMLKLEIINLKSKLELKDKVISTLVARIDNNSSFKPDSNKTPPESTSRVSPNQSRASPPRAPSSANSIASTSGSNKVVVSAEKKVERARLAKIEREILRNDEFREEIRLGKRIKLEPGLEEGEGEEEEIPGNDDPALEKVVEKEITPIPAAVVVAPVIPVVPAVLLTPPPPKLPLEAKDGRIYEANIQPLRISFPDDIHGAGFRTKGKDHFFSIGYTRENDQLQCITIESEDEAGVKSILIEFEPSALHSAAHPEGELIYRFSFGADAHEVWQALSKASDSPFPALNTPTPNVTFMVIDPEDNALIEEMVERFVTSVPYTHYHNIKFDEVEVKAYLDGLEQRYSFR